jgi:hypothetical protein
MKKLLLTALFLSALLVSLVGTAAAAPLAGGGITLLSVDYLPGKGPVFTFQVNGHFSRSDLKGFVHVEDGADYDLHCTQVDEMTVKCTTSDKVAGKNVALTWGGSTFWASVPATHPYCYAIWDWWDFTNNQWTNFGPHCQAEAAQFGDLLIYEVPDPAGSYDSLVVFFDYDVSGNCEPAVPYNGGAYYYPFCPY